MKFCPNCGKDNRETAKFCEECGNKFPVVEDEPATLLSGSAAPLRNPATESARPEGISKESFEPGLAAPESAQRPAEMADDPSASFNAGHSYVENQSLPEQGLNQNQFLHSSEFAATGQSQVQASPLPENEQQSTKDVEIPKPRLILEKSTSAAEFPLLGNETHIGRWDADNGIFPDIDLDPFDPDAKVSRRHARITVKNDDFFIEDLGSTNGTFINRGRRLIPGSPQKLNDGDEIIVGKTFLRFRIS
jgi:hypothetical protein